MTISMVMLSKTGNDTVGHDAKRLLTKRRRLAGAFAVLCLLMLMLGGCASTPSGIASHITQTTDTRLKLVDAAAEVLGLPYRPGATGPAAFDDIGLVRYAYLQIAHQLPQTPHGLLGAGEPVAMNKASPGDLVFYQTHVAGGAGSLRVGLFLNRNEMLYASKRQDKVVIQRINGNYWRSRLLGVVKVLPTTATAK